MKIKHKVLVNFLSIIILIFSSGFLHAMVPKVAEANGIKLWTENFGNKKDPAILLIMGNGAQGLLWPQAFCEKLAQKGYFVIRYDNRDVGLSDTQNFKEKPYTILDMAKDAAGILDQYQIQKAHIVGASMGGEIAAVFGAHFPERVNSLTLMMTSPDMRPVFDALEGNATKSALSGPKEGYLAWVKNYVRNKPESIEGKVEQFLEGGRIMNGSKKPFDEALYRELAKQTFIRTKNVESLGNHSQAMKASYDIHEQSLPKISAPTLILHGDEDPIFGVDHAQALNKAIKGSKLAIISGMGHAATPYFFDDLSQKITSFINQHNADSHKAR